MCCRKETPLFQIRDASVVRAGKPILHVENFTLHKGERIALLGPNGAGKSTFIQLLTREVVPIYKDDPPVFFKGNPRPTRSEIRSSFGVVSSTMHDQLKVHIPALDVVCGGFFGTLGLPPRICPTDEQRLKAFQAMEKLAVSDLAARDVTTLSTGQARRVLIARELVHDPQALVFDEPCTGLDPEGMYYVRKAMRQLSQEGKTLVLVTHYPEDIIPEVDRVLFIKDAKVFADGPKETLLESSLVSELFSVPLAVESKDGWYSLRGIYR